MILPFLSFTVFKLQPKLHKCNQRFLEEPVEYKIFTALFIQFVYFASTDAYRVMFVDMLRAITCNALVNG